MSKLNFTTLLSLLLHHQIRQGSKTPASQSNGGSVWKIISSPHDNAQQRTVTNKMKMTPRFTETKDKYYDKQYGVLYSKTMTLTGFDRLSSTITLPKKVVPVLIDWNSKIQYEVAGKILQQPRDWANLASGGEEADGDADSDNEDSEFASMADIDSQVSNPCALSSSSIAASSTSFDTPTHSSTSSNTPQSVSSIAANNKKGRYV